MSFPELHGPDADGIFVLNLGPNQNRFDKAYLTTLLEHLETVENFDNETALVVKSDSPKFFSNGLSFEALAEDPWGLIGTLHRALLALLTIGVPTVAAINGHAFAGGAMIAFCCDYRVMNKSHGFLCINEVELGFPLTPGLSAVVRAKIDRSHWAEMILGARRYTGDEALRYRFVHQSVDPEAVWKTAMGIAKKEVPKGKLKKMFRGMKEESYAPEIAALRIGAMGRATELAEQFTSKL